MVIHKEGDQDAGRIRVALRNSGKHYHLKKNDILGMTGTISTTSSTAGTLTIRPASTVEPDCATISSTSSTMSCCAIL